MENVVMEAEKMVQNSTEASGVKREVYLAGDIMQMLGIGRSKAYAFLDKAYKTQQPFRVIKVGKLVRVPKQSFDNWLQKM